MELNPKELAIDAIVVAQNVGRFVLDRLQGGAWIHQPHFDADPVTANIQVHEANIIKGEE